MQILLSTYQFFTRHLNQLSPWIGWLLLRMLIGWEFLDSGLEKYGAYNWFSDVQNQFPFPFNQIPPEISWLMATWFEIIGGIALMLGFATRFFAISLIILTIVATATIHWPSDWNSLSELWQGYAITDKGYGNFKLPLIFLTMLLPLLFIGAGRLSFDYVLQKVLYRKSAEVS